MFNNVTVPVDLVVVPLFGRDVVVEDELVYCDLRRVNLRKRELHPQPEGVAVVMVIREAEAVPSSVKEEGKG